MRSHFYLVLFYFLALMLLLSRTAIAETTLSPYMGLPVPQVGVTPGPNWATAINQSLGIIDQHNHTPGNGQQIPSNGININDGLAFNDNIAYQLQACIFIPGSFNVADSIYVNGVDLYYNDGNSNKVRLTQNGAPAGTPGSISNLVSPASASYSSGSQTFIWQSNINTPANMDGGSFTFRNITANSNGITLSAPNALAENYTVTFPDNTPATTSIVQMSSAGTLASSNTVSSPITIGSGGAALSNSSTNLVLGAGLYLGTASGPKLTNSGTTLITSNAETVSGNLQVNGIATIGTSGPTLEEYSNNTIGILHGGVNSPAVVSAGAPTNGKITVSWYGETGGTTFSSDDGATATGTYTTGTQTVSYNITLDGVVTCTCTAVYVSATATAYCAVGSIASNTVIVYTLIPSNSGGNTSLNDAGYYATCTGQRPSGS